MSEATEPEHDILACLARVDQEIAEGAGYALDEVLAEADALLHGETLYLLSIPGMRDSILQGLATSAEECSEDPGW